MQHFRLRLGVANPHQNDDQARLDGYLIAVLYGILTFFDLARCDALAFVLVGRTQVLQCRGRLKLIMEDYCPKLGRFVVILEFLEDECRLRWGEPFPSSFFIQVHAFSDQSLDAVLSLLFHKTIDDPHQRSLFTIILNPLRSPQSLGQQHLPNPKHTSPSDIRRQQTLLKPQGISIGEPKCRAIDESGCLVILAVVSEYPCIVGVLIVEAEVDCVCDFEVLLLAE